MVTVLQTATIALLSALVIGATWEPRRSGRPTPDK
jgi:hypothetical protein